MVEYGQRSIRGKTCHIKESNLGAGTPRCFCLYNYDIQAKPCAYVFIFEETKVVGDQTVEEISRKGMNFSITCQLWHIWTLDKERDKGYASALIDLLKTKYLKIVTQIETEEGKSLCLKNGFSMIPASSENDVEWLVWGK